MAKFLELKQNVNTYQVIEVEIHMEIFRDEFDGTHGIQLVAIEIFSCLVRNFFS